METREKVDNRYNNFRLFCSQINEANINVFRSNNFFRSIVENVNNDYGNQYHNNVVEKYNDYIDLTNVDWRELESVMKIGTPLVMDNYIIDNQLLDLYEIIEKNKENKEIQKEYYFHFIYGKYYAKQNDINLSNFYFCQFFKTTKQSQKIDYYCNNYDKNKIPNLDNSYALFN